MADLNDYVARLVATAPPLDADQVDRLAALLGARTDRPARISAEGGR